MTSRPATTRTAAAENVAVRPIAATDLDTVIVGWHETNLATYTYVAEHQKHTLDDARRFFVENVLAEGEVWVAGAAADDGETLCGVIALRGDWITQFAIFDGWRQRGIGSRLLDLAKSRLPQGIELYTFQRNTPARRFYERHGFVAAAFGVSPAPEGEPDVLYRWTPVHG